MPNSKATKFLIDDYPVVFSRLLPCIIGFNETVIVQQIHYWVGIYQRADNEKHFQDGEWWVWNSIRQWREDNFPWWSEDTITRVINRLAADFQPHARGDHRMARGPILIVGCYNTANYDRTRWYRLDYDELDRVIEAHENQERARLAAERMARYAEREPLFAAAGIAPEDGEEDGEEDFSDMFDKGDRSETPADDEPGILERARELGATGPLALGALIESETGGASSWTVPQEAGGASVYAAALQNFCAITRRPVESLDEVTATAWLKKLERTAQNQRIESPAVMAEAIRRLRDTHAWYLEKNVWASPFVDSFIDAVGLVAARITAGEFEGQDESDDNRTRGKHEQQAAAVGLAGNIT